MDTKIERTYFRKAFLHRQLFVKMEKPSFGLTIFISTQIHLASNSSYVFLARMTCL